MTETTDAIQRDAENATRTRTAADLEIQLEAAHIQSPAVLANSFWFFPHDGICEISFHQIQGSRLTTRGAVVMTERDIVRLRDVLNRFFPPDLSAGSWAEGAREPNRG